MKREVSRLEKTVLGIYYKILRDIKPKNNTIYLIITCVMQSIEQSFNKKIPVDRFVRQLDDLLSYVVYTAVKDRIKLPSALWHRLRDLFRLMAEDYHATVKWDAFLNEKVTPIVAQIYKVTINNDEEDRNKDKIMKKLNEAGHMSDPGDHKDAFSFLVEKYERFKVNFFQKRHKSDHDDTVNRRKSKIKHLSSDQSSDDVFERAMNEHHHKCSSSDSEPRETLLDSSSEENVSIAPTENFLKVVLFRVFLTIRGNPNQFESASAEDIHTRMFESLGKITVLLRKIDDRQGLHDQRPIRLTYSKEIPPVPVNHVLPWAFQVSSIPTSLQSIPTSLSIPTTLIVVSCLLF